jgi:hypothetical protein
MSVSHGQTIKLGAYSFQWRDESALVRMGGENYDIDFLDVTDRPYAELIEAAKNHAQKIDGRAYGQVVAVCTLWHRTEARQQPWAI